MKTSPIAKTLIPCLLFCAAFSQAKAHAQDNYDRESGWRSGMSSYGAGLVSAAGGIVEPSYSTAVFTDPAGLTELNDFRLTLQAGSDQGSLGSPTLAGGLLYGRDIYGMGAGISHSTLGAGATSAFYGLGVEATPIHTSFGLSASTPLSPSGGTTFNGAIRTAVTEDLEIALEALNFTSGPGAWGAGISYQAYPGVRLLSDFTTDKTLGNWEAQPGVLVGNYNAQLTVSYGFRFNGNEPHLGYLSDGISVGGGLNVTQNVSVQLYYQQLMTYYGVVSIAI